MNFFRQNLNDLNNTIKSLLLDEKIIQSISKKLVYLSKKKNSKILVCRNGGSATDDDHFVTELVV
tara:strand:- start:880 stop:1074 length:195 start_codon:yes stop_codon:yes gene_type:complete